MEITPTYVTFEQAKKLKDKGWNLKCKKYYNGSLLQNSRGSNLKECYKIYAPEHWQVVEWLRVNHGIWITIFIMEKEKIDGSGWECYYDYSIKQMKIGLINISKKLEEFNFPQEATSAGIDYVLDNLI
jgi:hypothetical protein